MITFLRGRLTTSLPDRAAIDVGGVGYEVFIPISTYDRLGETGREVTVLTHLQVREDAHVLYGFATEEERDLFRLLINRVTGVGPKMGLSILSGMSVRDFQRNVVQGDTAALSKISGVGKKTAERIILELKDKVGVAEAWREAGAPGGSSPATPQQVAASDAVLALIHLGYKQAEAQKAVKKLMDDGTPEQSDALVRGALRMLSQG